MIENICFIIRIKIRKVSISTIKHYIKKKLVGYKFSSPY